MYILTPQGISSKTKLTITFMQKKIKEYDELKSEIVNLDNVKINHPNNKKIDKSLL